MDINGVIDFTELYSEQYCNGVPIKDKSTKYIKLDDAVDEIYKCVRLCMIDPWNAANIEERLRKLQI